jgi:DNA-binding MarR family transcriptional regulator
MIDSNEHQYLVQSTSASLWRTIPPIWNHMRSIIHRIAREDYGITSTQFQVLHRIREENKKTVSELSDCMVVSRPSVSRAVDELVRAGLIERKGDSVDRRVVYLKPSAKGEEIISKVHAKNNVIMQEVFSSLDDRELKSLASAFQILEKVLDRNNIEK